MILNIKLLSGFFSKGLFPLFPGSQRQGHQTRFGWTLCWNSGSCCSSMLFYTLFNPLSLFILKEKVIQQCGVVSGCKERGQCAVPEELRGQLVWHNPGLVVQEEALTGEWRKQLFGILCVSLWHFGRNIFLLFLFQTHKTTGIKAHIHPSLNTVYIWLLYSLGHSGCSSKIRWNSLFEGCDSKSYYVWWECLIIIKI